MWYIGDADFRTQCTLTPDIVVNPSDWIGIYDVSIFLYKMTVKEPKGSSEFKTILNNDCTHGIVLFVRHRLWKTSSDPQVWIVSPHYCSFCDLFIFLPAPERRPEPSIRTSWFVDD